MPRQNDGAFLVFPRWGMVITPYWYLWYTHPSMKRFVSFFLIISFLVPAAIIKPSFAAPQQTANDPEIDTLNQQITEKKNKIKEIEKSIEVYKKEVEKKRTEAVSLSNQLGILDNRITQTELDIRSTQEKLETIQLEIKILEKAIAEKEEAIARHQEIIAEFLRNFQTEGDKNLVEILAIYDTFSEFYNRLQYLQTVEQDLSNSTKSLKIAKADLEVRQKETESKKESYKELNENLVGQKDQLEGQADHKETLLTETQASEMKYKTLLANLKKQYQQVENEIGGIERAVRKKLDAKKVFDEENKFDDGTTFSWPTQSKYVTAKFHDTDYPFRNVFEHSGIDIRASQGTPIRAAGNGYIAKARKCGSWECYAYVLVVHANGLSTLYGHLSNIVVAEDQFVTKGDIIGYSGGTPKTVGAGPFVTGAHLHFEVRKNGIPVNPLNYLH